MIKSLVFCLTLMYSFVTSAQEPSTYFAELTYAGTGYSSFSGTQNDWNSGFGVAASCFLNKSVSVEIAYHNAWINETIVGKNYRLTAHWTAFHLGFGRAYEKWSLHFLVGPSFVAKRIGLELGSRFTHQLTNHLAIHSSLFLSYFSESSLPIISGGTYPEPLSTSFFFNANLGLAWHFKLK